MSSGNGIGSKRLARFIEEMCENSERAEEMSNEKLAETLKLGLWASLDMSTYDSCLLGEAIHRLDRNGKVKE